MNYTHFDLFIKTHSLNFSRKHIPQYQTNSYRFITIQFLKPVSICCKFNETCILFIKLVDDPPFLQGNEHFCEVAFHFLRLVRGHGHRLFLEKEDVKMHRAEVAPPLPDVGSVFKELFGLNIANDILN